MSGGARVEMWCALTSAVSSATECDRVQILRLAPPTLLASRIWHCFRRTAGYGQPGLAGSECGSGPAGCSTRAPGCCRLVLQVGGREPHMLVRRAASVASGRQRQRECQRQRRRSSRAAAEPSGHGRGLSVEGPRYSRGRGAVHDGRACPGPAIASTQRGGADRRPSARTERRRESLNPGDERSFDDVDCVCALFLATSQGLRSYQVVLR